MYLMIGILLAVLTIGSTALLMWQKQREAKAKVAKQRVVEARDTVADFLTGEASSRRRADGLRSSSKRSSARCLRPPSISRIIHAPTANRPKIANGKACENDIAMSMALNLDVDDLLDHDRPDEL